MTGVTWASTGPAHGMNAAPAPPSALKMPSLVVQFRAESKPSSYRPSPHSAFSFDAVAAADEAAARTASEAPRALGLSNSQKLATSVLLGLKRRLAADRAEHAPRAVENAGGDGRATAAAALWSIAGDRSADHVRRCLELVADLDRHYAPQSPVHGLYQSFLHEPSSVADYKERVLAIVAHLKPNQRLLHKFYGLLPPWVFR